MPLSTLAAIIVAGATMALLSLTGSITLLLPDRLFNRIVLPLVSLAAGTLLGGALFHMVPEAVRRAGNSLDVYFWLAAGMVSFLVLEQYLDWHHCHRRVSAHKPVGYLVLFADGLHNLVDGLALGAAFLVDIRLGLITWLVEAAHEVPQEIGDFGILVQSGWSRTRALVVNLLSGTTVLLGALMAYFLADLLPIGTLLAFAAGNFLYIALSDLVPQVTARPALREKVVNTTTFVSGLALLMVLAIAG